MLDLSERQVEITEQLRKEGFLAVDALATKYGVTSQTIRRDLTTLCDHGLARRRHGGIERPADAGNLAYGSRQILARSGRDQAQPVAPARQQLTPLWGWQGGRQGMFGL